MLDREALTARKERAVERLDAMLAYLSPETRCRESALLAYFGERDHAACGNCDRCRDRAHLATRSEPATRDTGGIGAALEGSRAAAIERLRWEVDEGNMASPLEVNDDH